MSSRFFKTQVVGDCSEAEACLYLEQNMGASVADAEWAEIYEVCVPVPRVHFLHCRLVHLQVLRRDGQTAAHATSPVRHVQVCGGNAGDLLAAIEQCRLHKDWEKGGLNHALGSCFMPCCHMVALLTALAELQL